MFINDLLVGIQKRVGYLVLGAALAFGQVYACGDEEGCTTDMDCKDDRVCIDGYCQGGSDGNGNGGNGSGHGNDTEYTCESGVQMIIDLCCPRLDNVCDVTTYDSTYANCMEEIYHENNPLFPQAVFECYYDKCSGSFSPLSLDDLEECRQMYFN